MRRGAPAFPRARRPLVRTCCRLRQERTTRRSQPELACRTARITYPLIGQSGNPNDVVITSTLDDALAGTTGSATLQLKGNNVSAMGITFANSTDTPYIVSVSHLAVNPDGTNSATAQTANQPCVALIVAGRSAGLSELQVSGVSRYALHERWSRLLQKLHGERRHRFYFCQWHVRV